jgi:hypothetical protein
MSGASGQPRDLTPVAAAVRRGGPKDREGTQGLEKGKHQAQKTGRRSLAGRGGAQGIAGGKMVDPVRAREAVGRLQPELELSQRRACKVVGRPRSTPRRARPRRRTRPSSFRERSVPTLADERSSGLRRDARKETRRSPKRGGHSDAGWRDRARRSLLWDRAVVAAGNVRRGGIQNLNHSGCGVGGHQ